MDRLKTQSDVVGVRANKSGRLEIIVRTDNVSTEVCWNDLSNPSIGRASDHFLITNGRLELTSDYSQGERRSEPERKPGRSPYPVVRKRQDGCAADARNYGICQELHEVLAEPCHLHDYHSLSVLTL